jgi:hypothetical protein
MTSNVPNSRRKTIYSRSKKGISSSREKNKKMGDEERL